jgi:hypothetical protein
MIYRYRHGVTVIHPLGALARFLKLRQSYFVESMRRTDLERALGLSLASLTICFFGMFSGSETTVVLVSIIFFATCITLAWVFQTRFRTAVVPAPDEMIVDKPLSTMFYAVAILMIASPFI